MENKREKVVYVSGAYTAKTKKEVEKNVQKAKKVAISVWYAGFCAICPHLNTYHFDDKNVKIKHSDFMKGDIAIVEHCDAVLMMKDWEKSKGAKEEHDFAKEKGIPVFYSLKELEEWGKTSDGLEKERRLAMKYSKPVRIVRKKSRLGDAVFVSIVGVALSAFGGAFLSTGHYALAFGMLDLLLLDLALIVARFR